MYLAYLDDSGTGDKKENFQVVTAVIVKDERFSNLEVRIGAALEAILSPEKIEHFEEFHACQLYGGYGVFDSVEQPKRFDLIELLLQSLTLSGIPVVYGAVDKAKLAAQLYGSAEPLDVCFRVCLEGVEEWIARILPHDLALLIADDFGDSKTKTMLTKSFRNLRKRLRPPWELGKLQHLHDGLYFGNSKDSIGIQLADLCGYFIAKHLNGDDKVAEAFYSQIEKHIKYFRIEPYDASQK